MAPRMTTQAMTTDWADEDTEPGPDGEDRRFIGAIPPNHEVLWVEEDGLGMVLRVRRIATP
jgi:hypothetical protein